MLLDIYDANTTKIDALHMRRFVKSLAKLGLAFSELQIMELADSFQLFPRQRLWHFGQHWKPIPSFQPKFGEFGLVTYRRGELTDWESLGSSRYLRDRVRCGQFHSSRLKDLILSETRNLSFAIIKTRAKLQHSMGMIGLRALLHSLLPYG